MGFEDATSDGGDKPVPVTRGGGGSGADPRQFLTELADLIAKRKLVLVYTNTADATKAPKRLVERSYPCDFVILSVPNATDADPKAATYLRQDANNSYSTASQEVYWGSDAVCVHQVFPQQTTGFIPVRDANDIYIQLNNNAAAATQKVGFSVFKYEDQ